MHKYPHNNCLTPCLVNMHWDNFLMEIDLYQHPTLFQTILLKMLCEPDRLWILMSEDWCIFPKTFDSITSSLINSSPQFTVWSINWFTKLLSTAIHWHGWKWIYDDFKQQRLHSFREISVKAVLIGAKNGREKNTCLFLLFRFVLVEAYILRTCYVHT